MKNEAQPVNVQGEERLSRRSLLGRGMAVTGGLAIAQSIATGAGAAVRKPVKTGSNDPGAFSIVIGGRAMVTRPLAKIDDPEFLGIVKLFRDADVGYAHLEVNIAADDEISWTPRGSSGGSGYLITDPRIAADLAWAGSM